MENESAQLNWYHTNVDTLTKGRNPIKLSIKLQSINLLLKPKLLKQQRAGLSLSAYTFPRINVICITAFMKKERKKERKKKKKAAGKDFANSVEI